MTQTLIFSDLLKQFIVRDGRHVRQLSEATGQLFGHDHLVPHNTISRWLRGETKRPRQWAMVVALAAVLQLTRTELAQLLKASGQTDLDALIANPPIPDLFEVWQEPAPARLPPFQAPSQPYHLLSRQVLLGRIQRFMRSRGESHICCLLGMAGLGKTSLATQAATALRTHFADGVLWVQLDQTDTLSALQSITMAYGVDLSPYPDIGTRSSQMRQVMADKQALLILDRADTDTQLLPLLPPPGACRVLITTHRLDLATLDNAFRLMVPPFDLADEDSLTLLGNILPKERLLQEATAFALLADAVGQAPIAVQILAQRLAHEPGWTAAALRERWQQDKRPLQLLVRGNLQVEARLRRCLHQLTESDRALFAWLGLFEGSFSTARVADVCLQPPSDVADSLRRLHAHSLLQSVADDRYALHPLVKELSRAEPQPPNGVVRFVAEAIGLPDEAIGEEQANLEAAIRLAKMNEMERALLTAVLRLQPHLQQSGQLQKGRTYLALAEQVARSNPKYQPILIQLLHQAGLIAMKQGVPDQAESYYQEALTLARTSGDRQQTAEILHKLSALAYRRGHMEETAQFCQEGLTLARELEDITLTANLLTNLGLALVANGRLPEAISQYEEALALARQAKASDLTITLLQNLGVVFEHQGNYAQAQTYYTQGLALAEARQDPELRSRMLGNLGLVAGQLGNYAEATALFRQGLALAEKNGLTVQQYRQQANLGRAALLRGQHRQANVHYREALKLVRELNFAPDLSIILNQAGDCFLQQDAFGEAHTCFTEALALAEAHSLQRLGPIILFGLAKVAKARGNIEEARRLGEQSRAQLKAIGHRQADEVWWWLQELPRTTAPD